MLVYCGAQDYRPTRIVCFLTLINRTMLENTPFEESVEWGDYTTFRTLYSDNFSQEELDRALGYAAANGRIRMIRDLLAKGANIDSQDDQKRTPINRAAAYSLPRTLHFLLISGANDLIKDAYGKRPLDYVKKSINKVESGNDTNSYENKEILAELRHMKKLLRDPYIMRDEQDLFDQEYFDNSNNSNNSNTNNSNSNNSNSGSSSNNNDNRVVDIPNTTPTNIVGMNLPPNAPSKCFDPVMYNDEANITDNMTTFYIMSAGRKVIQVGCLDNEGLEHYKDDTSLLFFKCKPHVPLTAMNVRPTDVEINDALRKLSFKMNIYVNDRQMQSVKSGKKYILVPTNNEVGTIASYDVVKAGGALVSSDHCGFKYADRIHDIYEVNTAAEGGQRRPHPRRRTISSKRKAIRRTRRVR